MNSNLVFLIVCLSFAIILHKIKCNENLYTSSLNNVYYIENEQKFTWYDALVKCASMNMSWVTIDTKPKSQEVTALLTTILGKRTPLWIGACLSGVNPRQFVWLATGRKFVYTNWAPVQPDFNGNQEYCAQTGWTDDMEWNDHVCSYQFGFMCEYNRDHVCERQLRKELQPIVETRTFRDIIFNLNQYPK